MAKARSVAAMVLKNKENPGSKTFAGSQTHANTTVNKFTTSDRDNISYMASAQWLFERNDPLQDFIRFGNKKKVQTLLSRKQRNDLYLSIFKSVANSQKNDEEKGKAKWAVIYDHCVASDEVLTKD
jgi:hypothetical protein